MRLAKIFTFTTAALGLFPLLKLNHFSILMAFWFVLALILAFQEKTFKYFRKDAVTFLVLSFFCWMYVVYLPFASDLKEMNKFIVKSLPFLVFPVGFLLNKQFVTIKILKTFGVFFIASTVVLNVLGWVAIYRYGFLEAWNQNDFYHPMFRNLFSEATRLHLPYLGLFSAFSALCLVYHVFKKKAFRLVFVMLIAFLLGSSYIYSARMALGCFLIGFLFIAWKSIQKPIVKWGVIVVVPLTALLFIWFSPIKERYLKELDKELVLPHKGQEAHEVNYRYGIWFCASEVIKQNFIFGVGADSAQKSLNTCYDRFDYESYEDFTKVTYNSHNQYLDQFLKFGFLGFLVFCFTMIYFTPKSSILYQTFIIVVMLSFLTENFLDRQMGVVFISLFNSIFVAYKLKTFEKSISSRLVR